jgi:hypothetical protein
MVGAFRQIALLVSQMREWAKAHNVKNTKLEGMPGIIPHDITEIFNGRNQPTGEQVLVMQELIKARR